MDEPSSANQDSVDLKVAGREQLVQDDSALKPAPDETQSGKVKPAAPEGGAETSSVQSFAFRDVPTTRAHSAFTLITCAFFVFEFFFVVMYSDKFWFDVDVRWLGIPFVFVAMGIAHLLLKFLESSRGCDALSFIWKGKPPAVYTRLVRVNDANFPPGIRFGNKNLAWDAIDEVDLSFLGNLVLRSRAVCRLKVSRWKLFSAPDVVLKFPFGMITQEQQRQLISDIRNMRPNVVLNQRLTKRLEKDDLPAAATIPQLGAVFIALVLLDVGYSTFNYLRELEGFYLANVDAKEGRIEKAQKEYDDAENIQSHPLPISWVTHKLISQEPVASGLYQAQADALWSLGKKNEALNCMATAMKIAPKSFRLNLKTARMLASMGKTKEAENQLQEAMASKKDSFLPQLYIVALKQGEAPAVKPEAKASYDKFRKDLDLFADEPRWPPGGNLFLHDIWFSDDVDFVFSKLIGGGKQ
jgi:hypothetical protein